MCFVFYQGSRQVDESYHNSDIIVDRVIELVETFQEKFKNSSVLTKANQGKKIELENEKFRTDVSYIIRKSAHFFEYGLLAALFAIVFYLLKKSKINIVIYSLFITLMCAVADEFYQSFSGRGSTVRDIVLDFCGTLFGITYIGVVLWLARSSKSKGMKVN